MTCGGSRAVATVALAAVLVVVMVGGTLPTSVYRSYEASFGFGLSTVTFVYAAYAAGVLAALVCCGQWSDVLGRRPLLAAGLVAALASGACFLLADGLPLLLAGRLLSGVSAGIFVGTATAAVTEMATGPLRPRAPLLATTANVTGLGLGPLLGGCAWPGVRRRCGRRTSCTWRWWWSRWSWSGCCRRPRSAPPAAGCG